MTQGENMPNAYEMAVEALGPAIIEKKERQENPAFNENITMQIENQPQNNSFRQSQQSFLSLFLRPFLYKTF